jgi:hypothetical protein
MVMGLAVADADGHRRYAEPDGTPTSALRGRRIRPSRLPGLRTKGVHVRKKSILLRLAVAAAIATGTVTTALPASAAPATSIQAAAGTSTQAAVSPADIGAIVCNGNVCIQRSSPVVHGKANVTAWAYQSTFTGNFYLNGGQYNSNASPTRKWVGGGTGWVFYGLAVGSPKIQYWISGESTNVSQEGTVYFTM